MGGNHQRLNSNLSSEFLAGLRRGSECKGRGQQEEEAAYEEIESLMERIGEL